MSAKQSIATFAKRYLSRRFLGSTLVAPAIVSYGIAHGWPVELIEKLLMVLGVGVAGISTVDAINANRGFKRED